MSVLAHSSGAWAPAPPGLLAPSDEELVRRVRAGDRRAFEQVYERYKLPLHRYCHSIVRQREDAEEAFQATMLSAFQALGSGDARQIALRPWLYRIAHNECITTLRRRRRHEATELNGAEPAPGDVEADAQLAEDLRQLQRDLAELPERERSALVMRELGGLSHAEIGRALGEEAALVKQLIYQARVALHDLAAGRELACQAVRRTLSDGDGRALRGRSLKAHLRACAGCRDFQAAIGARPARLAALAPMLPAAAFREILQALGGGAAAAAVGAGAGGGGLAVGAAAAGGAALGGGGGAGGLAVKLAVLGAVALAGGGTAAVPAIEGARQPAAPPLVAPMSQPPALGADAAGAAAGRSTVSRPRPAARPERGALGGRADLAAASSDQPAGTLGGLPAGADAAPPSESAAAGMEAIPTRPGDERAAPASPRPTAVVPIEPTPVAGREPAPLSRRDDAFDQRDAPASGLIPAPAAGASGSAEPASPGAPTGPTGMADAPVPSGTPGRPVIAEPSAPAPSAPAIALPESAPELPASAGAAPTGRP